MSIAGKGVGEGWVRSEKLDRDAFFLAGRNECW